MPYPDDVHYAVTFIGDKATIDISDIPAVRTITVSWNGTAVYGPRPTNQSGQHMIDADPQASGNSLRVVFSPGEDETYARGGITPTNHPSGELPRT